MKKKKDKLKCTAPIFADVYRDGGSYGFGFGANDGKIYELHLRVVLDSPADCKRYYEPIIFKESCNSKEVIAHPTWKEAEQLIEKIKYDNTRFKELKWIIKNGGCAVPENT
ncbi:MAG TPA: hypothetical protein ENJ08_12945 [Gammaproteobacteria bacterium]|nr:hypothetical protein [Gammaproteobacteria bacterium]